MSVSDAHYKSHPGRKHILPSPVSRLVSLIQLSQEPVHTVIHVKTAAHTLFSFPALAPDVFATGRLQRQTPLIFRSCPFPQLLLYLFLTFYFHEEEHSWTEITASKQKCIHSGWNPGNGEARQIPIYQSTTFKYDSADEMGKLFDLEAAGYFYTRLQNPTNDAVAAKICDLEGGVAAMLTSSGQAANFYAISTSVRPAAILSVPLRSTEAPSIWPASP